MHSQPVHRGDGGKDHSAYSLHSASAVQAAKLQDMHRKMQRKLINFPKQAIVALGVALLLSVLTYGYIFHYFFWYNHLSDRDYLETHKCPACFGTSLCRQLERGAAKYTGYSRLQFLTNVKNVNFGEFGGRDVVFKKLAYDSELSEFDRGMCEKAGLGGGCNVSDAMGKLISGSKTVSVEEVKELSILTRCPSQRLVDRIVDKYREKADAIDISFPEKLGLIATLRINPEPLLLQMFPRCDGYPFPEYLGACGRFVVEEDVGKPLGDFYNAPWEERVDYATQIFRLAELFSNPPSSFALYWTDLSYENFAVDSQGKVRSVDAENIIVVDKWKLKLDKKPGWDEPFYMPFDECRHYGNCLWVYTTDLCARQTTDHNYYAACRNLLSTFGSYFGKPDGLLHGTPDDINQRYGLDDMLRECANPSKPEGRMEIKDKLLNTLEEIRRKVLQSDIF